MSGGGNNTNNNFGGYYPYQPQQQQSQPQHQNQPYTGAAPPQWTSPPPPPFNRSGGTPSNLPQIQAAPSFTSYPPPPIYRGPPPNNLNGPGPFPYRYPNGQYPQRPRFPPPHYPSPMRGNMRSGGGMGPSGYKRPRPPRTYGDGDDFFVDLLTKTTKKKKKPLSQNKPTKVDWTYTEAQEALNVERECNTRFRNNSLIIKFPDPELNRDIVSRFHADIENVHFQQPSTSRFCFVTLKSGADADNVIANLNSIRFGEGHLSAEYKRDREDDQLITPEDIDPKTLYVGNLAQEVTKVDIINRFTKCRRIDIGYAKKMKFTRYAFISFTNVQDSVAAFKRNHNTQLYSKSLIVRFRRLHGTVGMPGDTIKPPLLVKKKPEPEDCTTSDGTKTEVANSSDGAANSTSEVVRSDDKSEAVTETAGSESLDLSVVKSEMIDAEYFDHIPAEVKREFADHVKIECKKKKEESDDDDEEVDYDNVNLFPPIFEPHYGEYEDVEWHTMHEDGGTNKPDSDEEEDE